MNDDAVTLLYLPNEILCLILERLDPISLISCIKVCRKLNLLAKESHIYDYKTRLALSNLEEIPVDRSVGTLTRLQRLERHQKAWDTFIWSTSEKCNLDSVRSWDLAGGVLAFGEPDNVFRFIQLPSSHRGIERKEWNFRLDFGSDTIEDFTIDPSRNLLVVLTKRTIGEKSSIDAHILSLDDGRPHTCANTPTLCTRGQIDNVDWDYDIRSFGSHVGIICTPSNSFDSQLSMWNWETGNLIRRVSQVDSFAFLTENLIVYAPIEEEGTLGRRLIVLDLVLYPLVKLELPSFTKWSEICIHSESPPTRFEYLPNHQQVPFRVSRQDRLFAVGCRMWDNSHMDMVIFVPLSTLLSHVEKARISALVTVLEWKSWGPTATRTLPFDFPDIWVCYIHGLRAAVLNRNTSSLSGVCFDIYDLNPLLDRQREDSQEASNSAGREPRRAISGHLPDISPSSLMLSEDALLVVSGDETEITVYSF